MATLTDAQLAYLESELGSINSALEDDLQERYDRTGNVVAVAHEVLKVRLAGLLSKPASFTLPGVVSKDTSANIRALQPQIDRLTAALAAEAAANLPTPAAAAQGRLVRTDRMR